MMAVRVPPYIGAGIGCGSAIRRQLLVFAPSVGLPQSRAHAVIEAVGNRIPIELNESFQKFYDIQILYTLRRNELRHQFVFHQRP